ncbi:MAG: leader peptidase (prepilin peptidase)/N-methyltransferase [Bradymonadia bacterium]
MSDAYLLSFFVCSALLWGALWGSFLNVVIWRLPRGESLSHPSSRCPKCATPIKWYDNIPVLSWIILQAKCRACKAPISSRYPGVELLIAVLSGAIMYHVAGGRLDAAAFIDGDSTVVAQVLMVFVLHFYFVLFLVAIAFIDLDLTIIPHKLSIPLIFWGLLTGWLLPEDGVWATYFPYVDPISSVIGFTAGFGMLFAVFGGYKLVRGIDGGGGGDLWLLGAIGANLGWMSLFFVLMASSIQGLIAALASSVLARRAGNEPGVGEGLLIQGAHKEEYWEDHPVLGRADTETQPDESTDTDVGPVTDAAEPEDDDFMKLAVPFGPFLALAAIEYIFVGHWLMDRLMPGILP